MKSIWITLQLLTETVLNEMENKTDLTKKTNLKKKNFRYCQIN